MEENKFVTEKLRTHAETEIRVGSVRKSDAVDAGSAVMKSVGRPRKKRRASIGVKVTDAVDWAGRSEGNEQLVTSDTSTKKIIHRKKSGLMQEVESVNYMLPEERNKAMASFCFGHVVAIKLIKI